jgi:phenylacetate-CoA ligase
MSNNLELLRSAIPGIVWPALPAAPGSLALALQYQLESSQWLSPADLESMQMRQLEQVLRHTYDTMPFWRQRFDAAGIGPQQRLTPELLRSLPLMTRADIQTHGHALLCPNVPQAHGAQLQGETSGSTGSPITYYGTALTQVFWRTFTLRDHLWHQRDLSGKLASIRTKVETGEFNGWGPSTDTAFITGPCVSMRLPVDIDAQLDWLRLQSPQYLISTASNLHWLARRSIERGIDLPCLLQARSFGAVLPEGARAMVRQAWDAALVDIYTAEELGYIALQCPQHEHYHVQSENLVVELLDESGLTCAPGQIGRVVVTTLHNFAMPLFRYALGDYAEAGEPCPCGRGLPVIRRILGRERNMLSFPDGRREWPSFPSAKWAHLAPIRQLQMEQKTREDIELRAVASRALTREEKQSLIAALQACLGYPFRMTIQQMEEIPRAASHKFEDFISRIAD